MKSTKEHPVPYLSTKGLSIVATAVVLIIAMLRAESKDIPEIVKDITDSSVVAATGWILALASIVASVIIIRILMRINDREINRLIEERNNLQARLLERK